MAKIYYDPDTDELIPVKKDKNQPGKKQTDEITTRLERIETELTKLNARETTGCDTAAFALGAYAGWKLTDGICNELSEVANAARIFPQKKCGCEKKKGWF